MAETEKLIVNSLASLSELICRAGELFKLHKHLVVTLRVGKDRTISQNSMWFKLYQRIAASTEIGETEDARRFCKLHIGVRIMLRDSPDFRAGWESLVKPHPYETKLELMGSCALFGPDGFPVTRLFSRAQGVEYTNAIAEHFTAKGVYFGDILDEWKELTGEE